MLHDEEPISVLIDRAIRLRNEIMELQNKIWDDANPGPWMTPERERKLRKWTNWSGHFAWGGFLALAAWLKLPHFPAVGVSIALGAAWELLYWKFSDSEDATGRACFIDWAFWILGAVAAGLLIVYFG